jgi:hypothetical protein
MNVPIATFGFMLEALKQPLAVLLCQLAAVIAIAGLCGRLFSHEHHRFSRVGAHPRGT